MKNILVPTDFSACAAYATEVALQLAASHEASLHLYSKLEFTDGAVDFTDEDKQAIHNANVLFEEWEEKAKAMGVEIITRWSADKMIAGINKYIAENAIDFMVMGSHGISGKSEYFIGSNTQKVVRSIHTPVLVIKEAAPNYTINKVAFASNFNLSDKVAFEYLLDFVKPFNPEIHLIQVNTSGWFREPALLVKEAMNDFKALCGDLTCKTHFFRDWTIDAGIRHLSQEIGIDLIAISNQKRHPLKRIFSGSNVEALVNHADAPVLSIDLKDVPATANEATTTSSKMNA